MLSSEPCVFQGYFSAPYQELEGKKFVIKNKEHLLTFKAFNISDIVLNNLNSDVDLKTKNIALIYLVQGNSASDIRVKNIEELKSKILIQLTSITYEDIGGSCGVNGLVFAFTIPKSYDESHIETRFNELYTSFDSEDRLPDFLEGKNLQE